MCITMAHCIYYSIDVFISIWMYVCVFVLLPLPLLVPLLLLWCDIYFFALALQIMYKIIIIHFMRYDVAKFSKIKRWMHEWMNWFLWSPSRPNYSWCSNERISKDFLHNRHTPPNTHTHTYSNSCTQNKWFTVEQSTIATSNFTWCFIFFSCSSSSSFSNSTSDFVLSKAYFELFITKSSSEIIMNKQASKRQRHGVILGMD